MKNSYASLVGLLALAGCISNSSEEPQFELAGEYRTTGTIVATNPVIMYTRTGPVNNPMLVDNFIRRRLGSSSGYFSRTDVALTDNRSLTLTIDAQNKATLVSTYLTNSQTTRATLGSRNPQYFVLARVDTAAILTPTGSPNRCAQLFEQGQLLQPTKRCQALPPATGYSQQCKFQPLSAVTIRNNQLYLPYLSVFVSGSQPASGTCSAGTGGAANYFNPALVNQLAASDTLVVQERELPLTKR